MNEYNPNDLTQNDKPNKNFIHRLTESKAAHFASGFFGSATSVVGAGLVIAALVGAFIAVHRNDQPNSPAINLALVNSASPSASPLIYGTNLAMYDSGDPFLTSAGAVSALQSTHAQLLRMPIRDSLTSNDYTVALTKMKQMGATPLLIVHGANYSGGDPYPTGSALLKIAKSIFPTQTVYVDFGNEEDLAKVSVQNYVSSKYGWNAEIPKFKQITGSNFKYGGPVNYQYDRSYIDTFVATANPAPDYAVWHAYAGSCGLYTGNHQPTSQAQLLSSIDGWNSNIQQLSNDFATQNGGAHRGMPMIIDEWNYAPDLGVPGAASPCYSNDQNFINAFFSKALNTFIADGKYGLIATAEFEALIGKDENMITSSNTLTFQGNAFKASYEANLGNTPPPPPAPSYSCTGLKATPTASNPLSYDFTATAQVANGATLNTADFTFGDGATKAAVSPSGTNTVTVNHPYATTGTYSAVAMLHFTVSGQAVSAQCTTQVVVSSGTQPTYSGILNATPDASNTTLFNFTGRTSTGGGASFVSASINFGDGKSVSGLKPASGQTSVQTSHTYAAPGNYTATATFSFLVSNVTKTTTATTQVVVSAPGGGGGGQQVVAADTFSRPNQNGWGTAANGQKWGASANSSLSIFTVKNNVALISNTGDSYAGILGPSLSDSQIVLTGRISSFNYSNFGGVLRYKDGDNWYKAYIDGSNLVVQKRLNANYTVLKQVPFKASANTNYTIRFQAVGNVLSAKVWAASSSEPSNWTATATDNTFQSGYDGLRALPQAGNVVGYYYYTAYKL